MYEKTAQTDIRVREAEKAHNIRTFSHGRGAKKRALIVSESESFYGKEEWVLFDTSQTAIEPLNYREFYLYDIWVGESVDTLIRLLEEQNVNIRVKRSDEYSVYGLDEDYQAKMLAVLKFSSDLSKFIQNQ